MKRGDLSPPRKRRDTPFRETPAPYGNTPPLPRRAHFVTLSLALLLSLLLAAPAFAVDEFIDVTASLSLTDGAARAEAYVPVTIKITNHLGGPIDRITVSSGGPVIVSVPWSIAPDETSEKVVPVYYGGGDLRLTVIPHGPFAVDESIAAIASPTVRTLGLDEVFLAAPSEPEPGTKQQMLWTLRAQSFRVMNLSPEAITAAERCGLLDAVVVPRERSAWPPTGRAVTFVADWYPAMDEMHLAFPPGAEAAVQPEAYRLFAQEPWPAETRSRLWLWLGLFALATGVAAALISRRRALVAVAVLVGLSAGAGALLWFEGGLRSAPIREARVYYQVSHGEAMCETFVAWAARGSEAPRLPISRDPAAPLPLPVVASSEAILAQQMVLDLADPPCVRPLRNQLLLHTLTRAEGHQFTYAVPMSAKDNLDALVKQPGTIAALFVRGDTATDAAGRSQSVDAWAAEWSASSDPDVAYAGRSLRWWAKDRYEAGRRRTILTWRTDPLSPDDGEPGRTRLPSLVVYQSP